jgi:hypothetical protein
MGPKKSDAGRQKLSQGGLLNATGAAGEQGH